MNRSSSDETSTDRRLTRDAALYVSIGALASLAVIAFLLYKDSYLGASAFLFITVSLFVLLVYSVPPLRLIDKGFGELLLSIQIAYLSPSIAYLLQAGAYHNLVVFISTPLVLLILAMFLALDFPSYAGDMKYERNTLLARLGWERVIPFHHLLVLGAYVLLCVRADFWFFVALVMARFSYAAICASANLLASQYFAWLKTSLESVNRQCDCNLWLDRLSINVDFLAAMNHARIPSIASA